MRNLIATTTLLICISLAVHNSFAQRFSVAGRYVTGITSLYELCPYTDYCTSNATSKIEDKTKTQCCESCSCADDCWVRNNCCKDKPVATAAESSETCEVVSIYGDQKQNWGYYVVTSCPTDESPYAKKCRGRLKTLLKDSVWVTDRQTNKIYANKYCALCHGVVDYNDWQLATSCREPMNGTNSPDEVIKAITDTCGLTMEPPSKEDHMDNICLIPDITTCNVTGQWNVYDKALETACQSFQQPYVYELMFKTTIYRNIYCFLCNSRHQLVSDLCTPLKFRGKTGSTAFLGLLDFNVIERKQQVRKTAEPVCDVDEINDPFQVIAYILIQACA